MTAAHRLPLGGVPSSWQPDPLQQPITLPPARRRRWPWYLAGGLLLAFVALCGMGIWAVVRLVGPSTTSSAVAGDDWETQPARLQASGPPAPRESTGKPSVVDCAARLVAARLSSDNTLGLYFSAADDYQSFLVSADGSSAERLASGTPMAEAFPEALPQWLVPTAP